jgi:hypothetical protein
MLGIICALLWLPQGNGQERETRLRLKVSNHCGSDCTDEVELWTLPGSISKFPFFAMSATHDKSFTVNPVEPEQLILQIASPSKNFAPRVFGPFPAFDGEILVMKDFKVYKKLPEKEAELFGHFRDSSSGYMHLDKMDMYFRHMGESDTFQSLVGFKYDSKNFTSFVGDIREECQQKYLVANEYEKGYLDRNCGDNQLKRCGIFGKYFVDSGTYDTIRNKERESRLDYLTGYNKHFPFFTKTGYKQTKYSSELHIDLKQYLAENAHTSKPETMPFADPDLTCYESDTWMLTAPPELSARMVNECREHLVEWQHSLGAHEMKMTASYGFRTYGRGAILHSHYDRLETHILSCIFNIRHTNMDKPWKLHLQRDDEKYPTNEIEIETKEGDLILYESSTLFHGRDDPLEGDEVVNHFIHFAPLDWKIDDTKREYLFENADPSVNRSLHVDVEEGRRRRKRKEKKPKAEL